MSDRDDESPVGSTVTNSVIEPLAPTPSSGEGADAPRLAPGTVLSHRYYVQRFIARGGMGEVYAVEDLELHQQIALKTIASHRANERGARERFRREVQLSRRVTHPNVCRLFDVGFHEDADGGTIIFYTMELLEGETLAARLARVGRMSREAALPIVEQIAAALDAAHAAGVVHCDFKPHNVLLVARGEGEPPRVVVTDFGLARALDAAKPTVPIEERMFGTPAYMAPEQVRGHEVTPRSDLYALGVTLFQIATGELPFVGSSRRETASLRLTHPPAAPRDVVPDLDPRWERAILHCLEREPERRPTHAAEAVRQLRAPRRPSRRTWALALALVMLAASTGATWLVAHRRAAERSRPGRRSLAVVGWSDRAAHGDEAWIGTALAVLLGDELAAGDELRLAQPDEVTRARRELGVQPGAALDAAVLARLHTDLDVDETVSGTYELSGGRLDVNVRVVDARGRELMTTSESGPLDDLRALATRLGDRVRHRLGVRPAAADERRRLDGSLPSSPEVIRLYAEGAACAAVYDYRCAVDKLNEVVRREPDLVMARRALSNAYAALSNAPASLAEAKAAFERSGSLPREQRILTEAVYRTRAGQLDDGVKLYQALATFYPDQIQYALSAIEGMCHAGHCPDSLKALDELRRSPDVPRDDARIDLLEATVALHAAEYQRSVTAARRAVDKARRRGAHLLVAEARTTECNALTYLGGDVKEVVAACDEALQAFQRAGDRGRVARIYVVEGKIARDYGNLDDARADYEQAAALYRALGSARGITTALGDLALVARRQGRLEEARKILEDCIALDRRERLELDEAIDLSNLGRLLHDLGDRDAAIARYQESLAISRRLGSLRKSGPYTLADLGILATEGGRFDEAVDHLHESQTLLQESKDVMGQIDAFNALATVAMYRDHFAEAHALIAKGRALPHAPSAESDAETDQAAASLAIAERRFDEAERLARHGADLLHRAKNEAEPLLLTTLAEALLEAGKIDEARQSAARAAQLTVPGADARLALALVQARLTAAIDPDRGVEALGRVRDEASRLKLVGRELWARFYVAQCKQRSAPSAARAELQAVRREARAHQMGWLARLAGSPR